MYCDLISPLTVSAKDELLYALSFVDNYFNLIMISSGKKVTFNKPPQNWLNLHSMGQLNALELIIAQNLQVINLNHLYLINILSRKNLLINHTKMALKKKKKKKKKKNHSHCLLLRSRQQKSIVDKHFEIMNNASETIYPVVIN